MEKLWYKAVMIFAFSMTVVAAGYFLTGLNDQLAQQVQSGAVDNMSVVVLDAGHGGMDGGATAAGVRECEINLPKGARFFNTDGIPCGDDPRERYAACR